VPLSGAEQAPHRPGARPNFAAMRRLRMWDDKEARADIVGVVLAGIAVLALVVVVWLLFGLVPTLILAGVLILAWIVLTN
jgi:MFS superfamily sulfate permease-like transporter